ncbi:hypothetical protein AQUCO_03700041v1 [Aquilegia coerulea]|uniref:Uncharacterized protein n=1 Tax=Aquilegia coerulea TaxID=218851 RepID=A0A2G5CT87_AQUCA|nr:hypothetical protein AQUCO_03700041v1 [Aquilegia coerulea]
MQIYSHVIHQRRAVYYCYRKLTCHATVMHNKIIDYSHTHRLNFSFYDLTSHASNGYNIKINKPYEK